MLQAGIAGPQAREYISAVSGGLAPRNGWTIAERAGDLTPGRTQRLLNRAAWDPFAAMGVVRRFAVAGLDEAALAARWCGLVVGALDETGQEKAGSATAGVQRQYLGCAGRWPTRHQHRAPGLCARARRARADRAPGQRIPAACIEDLVKSLVMGLPLDLEFRTKGQLASDIAAGALDDRHHLRTPG